MCTAWVREQCPAALAVKGCSMHTNQGMLSARFVRWYCRGKVCSMHTGEDVLTDSFDGCEPMKEMQYAHSRGVHVTLLALIRSGRAIRRMESAICTPIKVCPPRAFAGPRAAVGQCGRRRRQGITLRGQGWCSPSGIYPPHRQPRGLPGYPIPPETDRGACHRR